MAGMADVIREEPRFDRCYCLNVNREQVLTAIRAGCRSVDEIRAATGACGGCGSCRPEVAALLRETVRTLQAPT